MALLLLTSGCAYPCSVYGLLPLSLVAPFAGLTIVVSFVLAYLGCCGIKESLSKTTVVPTAEGFAVIFSMSHTIANGGTYYQIFNMLSADAKVIAMDGYLTKDVVSKVQRIIDDHEYREEMVDFNYEIGKAFFSYSVLRRKLRALVTNFTGQDNL